MGYTMSNLVLVIIGLLVISFICSILESVILSVSRPYIQLLIDKNSHSGYILKKLKNRIDEPIAAILTLNTISHTAGAAVSGALAMNIFGSSWMGAFSAILTLLILIFSEIIPKTLGAQYWKSLSPMSAYLLRGMIFILKPFIIPMNLFSKLLSRENPGSLVSKAEIFNYVRLGHSQGVLGASEVSIIENLFSLRNTRVKEIMTPRTVAFWLPPDMTVKEIQKSSIRLQFSRILLYEGQENRVPGIVLRRDIMDHIRDKKTQVKLLDLSTKPQYVPESTTVLRLLNWLVANKTHIAVVLNEYGDYTGIVTIEDAIETLLGTEIVDEFDPAEDMQLVAKKKHEARVLSKKKNNKSTSGRTNYGKD